MSGGVKFIRVNGRVVPIKAKGNAGGSGKQKDYKKEVIAGKNSHQFLRERGLSKKQAGSVSNFTSAGLFGGMGATALLGARTMLKSKSKLGAVAGAAVVMSAPIVGFATGAAAGIARAKSFKNFKGKKKPSSGV